MLLDHPKELDLELPDRCNKRGFLNKVVEFVAEVGLEIGYQTVVHLQHCLGVYVLDQLVLE